MIVITEPTEFQELCLRWRSQGLAVGLVPTMGFFHEGHLSLMREARTRCDKLAVTLFVNPIQFGPNEDLGNYPHDFAGDSAKAEAQGVDVLFAPVRDAMYAPDHATWIDVPELGRHLCGASRPGHFRGVCTVVAKFFSLAQPTVAVFGRKDWQQLAILRRMVRDLNMPVELVGHPIVREPDGLAMSSRNAYLTPEERKNAPAIHKSLDRIADMVRGGERDVAVLVKRLVAEIEAAIPGSRVDYAEFVDPEAIVPKKIVDGPTLAAVAVYVGKARLIDNNLIEV